MLPLLVLLTACLPASVSRNCDTRQAWYPDGDGDGIGEPTDIYIGCEAPEGWVVLVDTNARDSGDTGDTGNTGDTADVIDTASR